MDSAIDRLQSLTVSDVMAKSVVWVSTGQHMVDVARLLLKHEISSAPVVDEKGICVGIVSATDFLKRDAAAKDNGSPPHRARPAWTPEDTAGTFMSGAVQSVHANAPVLTAAKIMCAQHVHRLPVVDKHGKAVGIVSTMDVVAALLNAVAEMQQA